MYSTLIVGLFCHFVSNQKLFAEESYGYLIHDGFNEIPCTQNPLPDLCSFSHQVPDVTRMPQNEGSLTNLAVAQLNQSLQMISGYMAGQASKSRPVELCASTAQKVLCAQAFQLICTEEYILQNLTKIKESCKDAEKHCGNLTNSQFPYKALIDCSMPFPPMQRIKRQQFKCVRFPEVEEDPIPCAKRNYKVLAISPINQTSSLVAAHKMLARYMNNISKECFHDVAEVICKGIGPACDRNETMAVSLNSRQDCERIISCLNTTSKVENLQHGLLEMCRTLPDANIAKTIQLSLVYSEFEGAIAPVTENDTKVNTEPPTKPATKPPFANQTMHNDTQYADESSSSTENSFLYMTGRNTSLTATTGNPPTQVNITELPTPTIAAKTSTNLDDLQPKTENISNLSKSPLTQLSSELTNPSYVSATPLLYFSPVVKPSVVLNASTITPLIIFNVTAKSSLVSLGTTVRDLFNVTATRQSVSVDIKARKDPENSAARLNSKMNFMAIVLVISTLLLQIY